MVEFSLVPQKVAGAEAIDGIAVRAVEVLSNCATRLFQNLSQERVEPPVSSCPPLILSRHGSGSEGAAVKSPLTPNVAANPMGFYNKDHEDYFYLIWFPLLSGLVRIVLDSPLTHVRSKALDELFAILRTYGHLFSFRENHWRAIFKSVVMPIFEDLKDPVAKVPASLRKDKPVLKEQRLAARGLTSSNSAVWIHALRQLVEVVGCFFVRSLARSPSDAPRDILHFDASSTNDGACDSFVDGFVGQTELLENLLELMVVMTERNSENLSQAGIIHLRQFISTNSLSFTPHLWHLVTNAVERIFSSSIPLDLLKFPTTAASATKNKAPQTDVAAADEASLIESIDVDHALLKCSIQLIVLGFVCEVALEEGDDALAICLCTSASLQFSSAPASLQHQSTPPHASSIGHSTTDSVSTLPSACFMAMPNEERQRWMLFLYQSFAFANKFNSNHELRLALWKAGLVQQMPNLIKQETQSISLFISLHFHTYRAFIANRLLVRTHNHDDAVERTEDKELSRALEESMDAVLESLTAECHSILTKFICFLTDASKYQRDIANWSPVVILIFKEILVMNWGQQVSSPSSHTHHNSFQRHIPSYFRHAIRMIVVDRSEVRQVLQGFMDRIAVVVEKDFLARLNQ